MPKRTIENSPVVPLNSQSDQDRIIAYMLHPNDKNYKLSAKLADRLEKLRGCAEIIRVYGSSSKTIPILMSRYRVSQTEAYNIYNETQEVFGTTTVHNKEFMVDILIGNIMEARKMAVNRKDLKAINKADENLMHCIEKFLGDKEAIDWTKLQPANILFGWFPELNKVEIPEDIPGFISYLMKKKKTKELNIDKFQQ